MASKANIFLDTDVALDTIQHFTAKAEGEIVAIVTRNEADYAGSDLPVLSPDQFLATRRPQDE